MERDIRCIEYRGKIYLRKEDIVQFIQEVANAEKTDVRNRWYQAALNLSLVGSECE